MTEKQFKIIPVYACAIGWENLKPTEIDGVRWCGDCEQRVLEVTDANDLRAAVAVGRCVRSLVPELHHIGMMGFTESAPPSGGDLKRED